MVIIYLSEVRMQVAASIPETWLTAYQLLFLVAQARQSDTVLVHASGSGVGVAATQLVWIVLL